MAAETKEKKKIRKPLKRVSRVVSDAIGHSLDQAMNERDPELDRLTTTEKKHRSKVHLHG